jgi:hypothetical protein
LTDGRLREIESAIQFVGRLTPPKITDETITELCAEIRALQEDLAAIRHLDALGGEDSGGPLSPQQANELIETARRMMKAECDHPSLMDRAELGHYVLKLGHEAANGIEVRVVHPGRDEGFIRVVVVRNGTPWILPVRANEAHSIAHALIICAERLLYPQACAGPKES